MALPLPQVVSNVGPGGRLVTSMRGVNALANDILQNQIQGVNAQYAPLTAQAEAASKLAYANLMGPQFLAKLMGNQDILANIPDPQKRQALNMLYAAGSGQGIGANMLTNPGLQPQSQSLSGFLADKVRNVFSQPTSPQTQSQGNMNALLQNPVLSQQDMANIRQMRPGDAYTIQGNQQNQLIPPSSNQPSTFAENRASYGGIVKEGEESGKLRAQDIKELNDVVFNADTKLATLNDVNDMIASPEIRAIRQLPLLGRHEMGWYAKEGTPAQQQLVGRLYAQMGNIIKDSSRDFAGQFRRGEQQLLQGMKPNDSDTVDAMVGKAESLTVMTRLLRERAALTSQYMSEYHINKLQAQEMADKEVNGEEIRKQVHDKLNPSITIRNKKTGEQKTISVEEARKLGVPNV